jgi:hypothetical protein
MRAQWGRVAVETTSFDRQLTFAQAPPRKLHRERAVIEHEAWATWLEDNRAIRPESGDQRVVAVVPSTRSTLDAFPVWTRDGTHSSIGA